MWAWGAIVPLTGSAQCSDAGVCTLTSAGGAASGSISLSYGHGKSPAADSLSFQAVRLGVEIRLFEDSRITITLPFNSQSGPLGDVTGIGDLIVVWSQSFSATAGSSLDAQIGGRFATADVNAGGFPQSYQSGLGTNDLLLGLAYTTGRWDAGVGYQISRGRSANAVTKLKRGDDVMARAGYSSTLGDFTLRGEVLGIKRLHLSSVRDASGVSPEETVTIPDSDQLQINILADVRYRINDALSLKATAAVPLLQREINVDGLSRSFTVNLGLATEF